MKKLTFLVFALIFSLSMVLFMGARTTTAETSFSDNQRASEVTRLDLEVKDGAYYNTRAYYAKGIDLTKGEFITTINIRNLAEDGGFRMAFLSSKDDYPQASYGEGFGVYFWDETAWGHALNSSLRADLEAFNKAESNNYWNDAKSLIRDKADLYTNTDITVKVWNFDTDNYAISVTIGSNNSTGAIPKSKCGNLDPTNLTLMLTPATDSSRTHSYASNPVIDIKLDNCFLNALSSEETKNRVNASTVLELTCDNNPTSTRAYYKTGINMLNTFECDMVINNLPEDGGFYFALMGTNDDYPMDNYGDGIGIHFWDETAWGHTYKSSLRCDFYGFSKTAANSKDEKFLCRDIANYNGQNIHIKFWNYTETEYAIQIKMGDYEAIGGIAKSKCGSLDPTNCVLLITPTIDSSRPHSYESNTNLTISNIKGASSYFDASVNSPEHGTITLNRTKVAAGGSVTATLTPDLGYELDYLKVNNEEVTVTGKTYTVENVNANVAFEVAFKEPENPIVYHSVSIADYTNGTVTASETGENIEEGTVINFTFTPNDGYVVKSVKVNDEAVEISNNAYSLTLNADVVLTVEFDLAPAKEDTSTWIDGSGTGLGIYNKVEGTHVIELNNQDGSNKAVAYYSSHIDISKTFEAYMMIDQLSEDGAFRLAFMSDEADRPYDGSGNGFAVYFWDETAWGHPLNTYLRCDYTGFGSPALGANKFTEIKRCYSLSEGTYLNKLIYIKVWEFDENNLAVQINVDGTKNSSSAASIGVVPKSKIGSLDYTNCVLMLCSEVDSSRTHSYETNTKIEMWSMTGVGTYHNVTINKTGEGTATKSCGRLATDGKKVVFTVEPAIGYLLKTLTLNGEVITLDDNFQYTVDACTEDLTLVVEFEESEVPVVTYTVTFQENDKGVVTSNKTGVVAAGTKIVFSVKPVTAYKVSAVKLNGEALTAADGQYEFIANQDSEVVVEYVAFSVEEGSDYLDHFNNGRVNAEVTEDGTIITLALSDGNKGDSRAIYKEKVSLNNLEFSFVLNSINVDGGLRISFLASDDDYPMEGYGRGISLWFWDETAWGHDALTYLRSDLYCYNNDPSAKTPIADLRCITDGNAKGALITVKFSYVDETLKLEVSVNGTKTVDSIIDQSLICYEYNWNDCYMIITPENDLNRAHSSADEVVITMKSLTSVKGDFDPTRHAPQPEPDKTEYSIVYYDGQTVLKQATVYENEYFPKYDAPEKEGYDFEGWYLDKDFTTKFEDRKATKDLTVYAKYVSNAPVVEPEPEPVEPAKSGCKSSLATIALIPTAIAACGVLVLKKKKEN